jgi:hypothetical protein
MAAGILNLPSGQRVYWIQAALWEFILGGANVRIDSRRRMVAVRKAPPTQSYLS